MSDTEGQGGGTENEGADPSQPVESDQEADQKAEAAVAATDTGNVTSDDEPSGPTTLTADFSNVGTDDESGPDTKLLADWSNVGLDAQTTGVDDLHPGPESHERAKPPPPEHRDFVDQQLEVDWSNVGTQRRTWASVSVPAAPINPGIQLNLSPALTVFFSVSLDVMDLGMWTKMSGLGLQIESKSRPDTAMSFFEHHMPGHITYSHITLERPLSSDSQIILEWISTYHMLPIPTAGQIICLDQTGVPILMWELIGVSPVSWKGPSMDANGLNIATEQLTLAHMGFL
jgi:phage tail-like protein